VIPNIKPSQVYPLAGAIIPQSVAASATATTGFIQVPPGSKWAAADLYAAIGQGGAPVQLDLLQATKADGTGQKPLLTAAAVVTGSGGVTQGEANLDALVDANNGYRFVAAVVTNTGGAAALVAAGLKFGPNAYAA
jgi:hypothetical protein